MRSLRVATTCLVSAAFSLPAAVAEGGNVAEKLIKPQLGTMFWTVLTFVIMLVILRRFAWKTLLGALDAREKGIQDTIDRAARDREAAETALQQQRDLLAEAHRERSAALEQGRQDAERLKAEILDQANRQREQLMQQTEQQVQTGLRQAQAELRKVAADLAIMAAEKLVAKNLDDATQRQLVEEYLAGLEETGSAPS